jgi:hypothetical protein
MAPSGDRAGERVFNIKLQDDVVLRNFDIRRAAGSPDRAIIREFNGIEVKNDLMLELIPRTLDPTIAQAPMLSFIQVVRDDISEMAEAPEYVKSLEKSEAEALLKAAKEKLESGNLEDALVMYHTVSDAAPSKELRLMALEGMQTIGSPESLSRIARYCRDTAPILWDYNQPDGKISDTAIKVYLEVADNMVSEDDQRAIRMLKHALIMVSNLELRNEIVTKLADQGVEVGADAAKTGYITRWHLIGPFPRPTGADWKESLDQVCMAEPDVDLAGSYQVDDKALKWMKYISDQGMIDLEKLFEQHTDVSSYAYAEVVLPDAQDLLLKVGSDDSFRCWFNGEESGRYEGDRGWVADQDVLQVKGKKGVNTILLKISQAGSEWAFSARLTDAGNSPIDQRLK